MHTLIVVKQMNINYKKLIKIILITFLIGNIFTIFTMNTSFYDNLNKPFKLPSIIFPIVWSILFLLMSVSFYIISESNSLNKDKAYISYFLQLILNSFWTLFFFGLKKYLFSFNWIIIIVVSVIYMIYEFYKIDKKAALIQIPYLLWLIFAGYLNFMIYFLN